MGSQLIFSGTDQRKTTFLFMLTKGYLQNPYKHSVKKTDHLNYKYSQPAGDRALFSENMCSYFLRKIELKIEFNLKLPPLVF